MQTVQEALLNADIDQLVELYIGDGIPTKYLIKNEELTAKKYAEKVQNRIRNFIKKLQTMKITPPKEPHILFAFKYAKEYYTETGFGMVKQQELLEKREDAPSYAYEFSPQSEIVGFLISNDKYTQQNLPDLLVDVLNEASFFGFDQENLQEEQEELERRLDEIKSPDFVGIPAEDVFKELREKYGLEEDIPTEEEKQAEKKYLDAMFAYNKILYTNHINQVINSLEK